MQVVMEIIIALIWLFCGYAIAALLYIAKESDRKQEISIGYDTEKDKDKSCLIIAKKIDEHITVQEVFYGKEANTANRAIKMFKGKYILK